MLLTIVHGNGIRIDGRMLEVGRKFHVGMQAYVENVRASILSVHPKNAPDTEAMDLVEVSLDQLGYQVMTFKMGRALKPLPGELYRLCDYIANSHLLYGGGFGSQKFGHDLGVAYILTLEYDVPTQIIVTATEVFNFARQGVRALRCALRYATSDIPDIDLSR